MDREALARRLMSTFLAEAEEHVHAIDRNVLALERATGPGQRAEILSELFRTVHSLKGAARAVDVRAIESACHHLEEIISSERAGSAVHPSVLQLILETGDALGDAARRLKRGDRTDEPALIRLLPRLDAAARGVAEEVPSSDIAAAPEVRVVEPERSRQEDALLSIPVERLDALVTRGDELLIERHRFTEHSGSVTALRDAVRRLVRTSDRSLATEAPALRRKGLRAVREEVLLKVEEDLERLADSLTRDQQSLERIAVTFDDELRALRMTAFARACVGLERTARDLAREAGKDVEVVIEGADVELDRMVIATLRSPLIQLVRNAVTHGIESAEERARSGKSHRGAITISASLRGPRVQICVADDGRGVDIQAIRKRAGERGLAVPEEDRELMDLVFVPGFSTAGAVTGAAGRGIGLDIVRTRIESIGGSVMLSSTPGRGAEFHLSVPLTLTTIRALLFVAGGETLAIENAFVRRVLRFSESEVHAMEGKSVLDVEGALVPLVDLAATVRFADAPAPREATYRNAIVVDADDARVAFVVDALLNEQDVLVKSLGERLARIRHVSGATLLADGTIALILNPRELVSSAMAGAGVSPIGIARAERVPARRHRLLVVDDSVTTRALARSILEAAGYEVAVAIDGADAWRILQEQGADLVVTDLEMPRMDGFTLTETIRRSPRHRELPVVLVSGLESDADKARGMSVGADAYIVKSAFDQTRLLETIAQLLGDGDR